MSVQSAFNIFGASVGAAAISAVKAGDAQAQKKEQGLLAKEQYYEAAADLSNLQSQSEEAGKVLETANAKVDATKNWNLEGKNAKMLQGQINKRLTEQQAAQRAFNELSDKIEARKAMMGRAESVMKRTGIIGR